MHLLLWMNDMLDLICMGFAELYGTGRDRTIQNENICRQWDLNDTCDDVPNWLWLKV